MTIAACAVTGEGVVLGADSTSTLTFTTDVSQRYLNNEQKLFEIGVGGTLGAVTWGLGRIGAKSHRTRLAELADDIENSKLDNVQAVASRFAAMVWPDYDAAFRADINRHKDVLANPNADSKDKDKAKSALDSLCVGFCIAGRCGLSREPRAFEIAFGPDLTVAPVPSRPPDIQFWGANLFVARLLGFDLTLAKQLKDSGKWAGTDADLAEVFAKQRTPIFGPLPIRETVDVVHALIHMTIKVMKFTSIPPICGGRIELATITTDRNFRWVRHKRLSAALDHP